MSSMLHTPKTPKVVVPKKPPPIPETPPSASLADNLVEEKKKLKKKRGDEANLMTGGLGLKNIDPRNLFAHKLGGFTTMGVS